MRVTEAGGDPTPEQLEALQTHRDVALLAWEQAIAATVIHYINATIGVMEADGYDFYKHAKYWGEMRASRSFQFVAATVTAGFVASISHGHST